ncbi:MAG: T9SS type A sorting domain-containing protein, partial [Saprospiraceae bacterium]|nr:T9SS type A sorting domain-containing protein [Saprospiraceae bacterium]
VQTFTFLNYTGTRTGTFTNVNFPIVPGVLFTVSYFANSVVLKAEAASPLPVEMVDFKAVMSQGQAKINWITASERNNDGFEVQRSKDGETWEPLGFVAGKGNSTAESRYHFMDEAPLPGISYYRLLQLDLDGQHSFSDMVSIENSGAKEPILVYPNPFSHEFYLDHDKPAQVTIFDGRGQLLASFDFDAPTQMPLNMEQYVSGTYFLMIRSENTNQTIQVVKL